MLCFNWFGEEFNRLEHSQRVAQRIVHVYGRMVLNFILNVVAWFMFIDDDNTERTTKA